MCGHDGHMACLIGALAKILEKREIIPSNCTLRAIFQPAEEGFGGALLMINDGVLEGVDEIYGLHNVPWENVGDIFVKPGSMMSAIQKLKITVKGKGGHSSLIHELINPVYAASLVNVRINQLIREKYSEEYPSNLRFSFPHFETASACNVIPDEAILLGTFRFFDLELMKKIRNDILIILKEIEKKTGCSISIQNLYNDRIAVLNDPELTKAFVEMQNGKVRTENLPVFASEDFSDYLKQVPGVFFFLGGGTKYGKNLHTENYNFNDEIIDKATHLFFQIVKNRFNCI